MKWKASRRVGFAIMGNAFEKGYGRIYNYVVVLHEISIIRFTNRPIY